MYAVRKTTHPLDDGLLIAVPFLRDNYAYIVVCPATQQACVIDPGLYMTDKFIVCNLLY